jgi:hypothetical protein
MATPDVTVDIDDFVSGTPLASKSGYCVTLTEDVSPGAAVNPTLSRQAYTNSSGVATLSAVVPDTYLLKILGVGVSDRVITIPDEAGPVDASDLTSGDSVSSGDVSATNPLIAGSNITLTQKPSGLEIAATASSTTEGDLAFTDTSGALSVESSVANGESAIAYNLDTANALAIDNGSKLAAISNNGDRVFTFYPGGAIFAGKTTWNILGDGAVSQYVLANYHDVESGDFDGQEIDITTQNVLDLSKLGAYIDSTSGNVTLRNTSGGVSSYVLLDVAPSAPKFALRVASTRRTDFLPAVADGASAVAYKFDTVNSLANAAARIASFMTSGSEKAAILGDGRLNLVSAPPANASAAGIAGSITWDASFIYVCTATNTWKRVAIATW